MASGSGWNLWVWLVGVAVRRYIDFLILLIPTPLVSALFCSIPTFCSFFKMFFVLVMVLFVIYVIIFSRTHIQATMGVPRKPYEGLHITKKHTQTNVSYPVMDISCMPSRGGV